MALEAVPPRSTVLGWLLVVLLWLGETQEPEDWGFEGWIRYGSSVVALSDLDGDGAQDFAVSAPFAYRQHRDETRGIVRVHSGLTGDVLFTSPGPEGHGWELAAVSDVDGDAAADLASCYGAWITFLSGCSGEPILELRLRELEHLQDLLWIELRDSSTDLNGDGEADLLLEGTFGEWERLDSWRGGSILVSGTDGHLLGVLRRDDGAGAACSLGDLDGDGRNEVLIHSIVHGADRSKEVVVRAVSLSTDAALWETALPPALARPRLQACSIDDADGDGVRDAAVGVVYDTQGARPEPTPGTVWILSGRTGVVLHAVQRSATWDLFGYDVAPFADLDGDGVGDLLVSEYEGITRGLIDRGRVHVLSVVTGAILWTRPRPPVSVRRWQSWSFGHSVTPLGSLDGDHPPSVVVSAVNDGTGAFLPGAVAVFSVDQNRLLYTLP